MTRQFNYIWAKLFYIKFIAKFNSNMFIKGDVVYSKPNNVRNVVLGYKHILNEGFEYQMAMKPENTLIKKLYICIMKFINKIFRRS